MKPFTKHIVRVVAMDRANVDTDQIIPGEFLFWDWARNLDGSINPDFELNRPEAKGASVLVTRRNFGCGSSREHAPWALEDWGFRVLIAPSFADIFYNNCFKNGMLPIVLSEQQVDELFGRAATHPRYELTADLETCMLSDAHGLELAFDVEPFRRQCLLHGLDDIGLTLEHEDKIAAYERAHGVAS
jgi:3-isopropylmalate/(R)-2-methylmalate dehydratase small subunit